MKESEEEEEEREVQIPGRQRLTHREGAQALSNLPLLQCLLEDMLKKASLYSGTHPAVWSSHPAGSSLLGSHFVRMKQAPH